MTGSIFISILSQEPTFSSFLIFLLFIYFHQNFLILKNVSTAFEEKKHKNLGSDSTQPPLGHQLIIHICSNIVTKKSRKK
jgi:hypothetical protein